MCMEGNTIYTVMARDILLSRGLSPWHGIEWRLQKLGRSSVFHMEDRTVNGLGCVNNRPGLANMQSHQQGAKESEVAHNDM